jgi:exopolyphosphatase / guanosine-5'-triphosphate,3'-diphosphate pyrophosphatase
MTEKIAIIDMGTNTFHLLVAEANERDYRITHRDRLPVKIGKGGINQGYITPEGLQRAVEAMCQFRDMLEKEGVHTTYAFGTSALRNAKNGRDVVNEIKERSGIDTRIISGDLEAHYIYLGVRLSLPMSNQKSLIVDIGGGSVEFIIGDDHQIFWKKSFEIGAQRLLEQFQKHDPVTIDEIRFLDAHFDSHLESLLIALLDHQPTTLIGASGTFDTLSEIYCLRHDIPMNPEQTETPLTFDDFYNTYEQLISKTREQRMQIPGMIEMRVDMIVVACCLVRYVLSKHNFQRIRVSTYSLKEGVLASLLKNFAEIGSAEK